MLWRKLVSALRAPQEAQVAVHGFEGGYGPGSVDDHEEELAGACVLPVLPDHLDVEDAGHAPGSVDDCREELVMLSAFVDDIIQDGYGASEPAAGGLDADSACPASSTSD
ncbi:hypothetical protein WJX74_009333 [Apatococcus lobatus]|uniref:Uncharacterized protein n=1 Tax=Apatococcus lobatus TaxID=904363 RepID=A0AAW1RDG0_9CHLO